MLLSILIPFHLTYIIDMKGYRIHIDSDFSFSLFTGISVPVLIIVALFYFNRGLGLVFDYVIKYF